MNSSATPLSPLNDSKLNSPEVFTGSEYIDFVRNETKTLTEKVLTLQNAYEEYLDAEQDVISTLTEQKNIVNDNKEFERIIEVVERMSEYSKKLDSVIKRMDVLYDRVEAMKNKADETKTIVQTIPPGKPIPPPSKQLQNSVNTYVEKAKNTLNTTVSSAKTGDMREKISDNLMNLGDKMSSVFDKAKQTVQNLKN